MLECDIEELCSYGFDDCVIYDICVIMLYFVFVNCIVDGLGVNFEL